MHGFNQVTSPSCGGLGSDPRHHKQVDPLGTPLKKSFFEALRGHIRVSKSSQIGGLSIFQRFVTVCLVFAHNVNALPIVYAVEKRHSVLRDINTILSFNPVSLIALFFDGAEKQLMERSGDLTISSCFGLFVNPTTAWWEYGTLHPGSGLQYYVPTKLLTSTIEVAQVNNFLITLARGRRNCGIIVNLGHSKTSSSWEWKLRPILPIVMVVFVGLDRDLWGLGAIVCLFIGQALVIIKGMHDGRKQKRNRGHDAVSTKSSKHDPDLESNIDKSVGPDTLPTGAKPVSNVPQAKVSKVVTPDEQATVIFLANNVTVIVKCKDQLFVKATAAIHFEKVERPPTLEMLAIMVFMAGVLMVGFAGINFKIVYLVGHAVQAVVIAFGNASRFTARHVNGVTWSIESDRERLDRRRDAYRWATEHTGGSVGWLTKFLLAPDDLVSGIESGLAKDKDQKKLP